MHSPTYKHGNYTKLIAAFHPEGEVLWRRGPSLTYYGPPWIHPWADLAQESIKMCGVMSTLSLPSLVNIHQAIL